MNLKEVPTCTLVEELKAREGVDFITADPYVPYSIKVEGADGIEDTGAAILMIVTD